MKQKNTIFLTGATGLVGSYLLKILLQNGHRVYALSRNKDSKSAKQRVVDILNFWDRRVYPKYRPKLIIVEGDITKRNLGLHEKEINSLKKEIEEIFHCAAEIKFNIPLNAMRKINVEGTKNVMDFGLSCKKLKKVSYLSTAYVCGDYKGIFKETDLDVGQKFNTTYEKSKFEAEKLVPSYRRKGLSINIFRPALVVGESTTGKTPQFKHAYQFLQICKFNLFDALPLKNARMNLVPVDFVSNFIYKISQMNIKKNRTFHTFPTRPVPVDMILDKAAKIIGFKKPKIVDASSFHIDTLTPIQRTILTNNLLSVNAIANLKGNCSRDFSSPTNLYKILTFAKNQGMFK
jgi:thioester reductase-like protein